jgi:hypothetical protein
MPVRRSFLALPLALLLSLLIAGTAFATHCGNENKQAGAGQLQTILVDPASGQFTFLEGGNDAGKFRGAFIDVYLDFDFSGDVSSGDGFIDDTYVLSQHSGRAAPGQEEDGLAVIPSILRGTDPAGPGKGVGFASFSFVP